VPVSNGEVFLSLRRAPRKILRLIIFLFLGVHNLSTEYAGFSAAEIIYPRINSQLIHRSPGVTAKYREERSRASSPT
jgi:hypothetical protein